MNPLVSPLAHIYLSTRSLWVQLLRLVRTRAYAYVTMCVFQISVPVSMPLSFSAELNSFTSQQNTDFGHTCHNAQPPANPKLCCPQTYHPLSPRPKLRCWWETGFWHLCQCNLVFWKTLPKALIAHLESIMHLKVIIVLVKVYFYDVLWKVNCRGSLTLTAIIYASVWFYHGVQALYSTIYYNTSHTEALQTGSDYDLTTSVTLSEMWWIRHQTCAYRHCFWLVCSSLYTCSILLTSDFPLSSYTRTDSFHSSSPQFREHTALPAAYEVAEQRRLDKVAPFFPSIRSPHPVVLEAKDSRLHLNGWFL